MKKTIAAFFIILIPAISIGQQVELAYGIHVVNGGFNNLNFTKGERTKVVSGINVKQIYKNFGLYFNWYSSTKKQGEDSLIIHRPPEFVMQPVDSFVYDLKFMPYGFCTGVCYTFPYRITLFAGMGISSFRKLHAVYFNDYHPTATGFYSFYQSEYSEKYYEPTKKICFELLADYDFLKSNHWSAGSRLGYNTQNKWMGQIYFGYNFYKK